MFFFNRIICYPYDECVIWIMAKMCTMALFVKKKLERGWNGCNGRKEKLFRLSFHKNCSWALKFRWKRFFGSQYMNSCHMAEYFLHCVLGLCRLRNLRAFACWVKIKMLKMSLNFFKQKNIFFWGFLNFFYWKKKFKIK
jgi:hypothetical protein